MSRRTLTQIMSRKYFKKTFTRGKNQELCRESIVRKPSQEAGKLRKRERKVKEKAFTMSKNQKNLKL